MRNLLWVLAFVLVIGAAVWLVVSYRSGPSKTAASPANELSTAESEASPEPALTQSAIVEPFVEEAASIRGYVQSLETGEGIEGATVKVSWKEEEEPREVKKVTDAEGGFAVASRGAGDYVITVSHAALVSEERSYSTTIREGEPPSDLIIWMTSGGVISGCVYDSVTNEGIAGVKVGLNRKQSPGVMTDADGRYRLTGIRTGKRRVFIGGAKGYIDSPRNSDGVQVTVLLVEELSSVDFPLQPGVFAAIKGKVVDERGQPVAGAAVGAISQDRLTNDYQGSADMTKADGTFLLADLRVASGFYVTAHSDGRISDELGPLGLTVDGIGDLVLTLRPLGSISGQVVDENSGKPVAEPEFVVDALHTSRGHNIMGGLSDNLDEKGNFELVNLPPGSYGLFIDSDPNVFRTGIVQPLVTIDLEHGQHVKDVLLTFDYERYVQWKVTGDARPANPKREAKPHVGEVRGRVVNARTDDAVTTFELKATHRSIGSPMSSQTVHDPAGRFTIAEQEGETLTIAITAKGYVPTQEVVHGALGAQPVHDIIVRLDAGGGG